MCLAGEPDEAQSPLIVDTDRVLAAAVATEGFELIARSTKVVEIRCRVKEQKLSPRGALERLKALNEFAPEESLGVVIGERTDHPVLKRLLLLCAYCQAVNAIR